MPLTTESLVQEAAREQLARGDLDRARELALLAVGLDPLHEDHHAMLIRIYRLSGDEEAARRQFDAWSRTAGRELGTTPGPAVLLAMKEQPRSAAAPDAASIAAVREVGVAAVKAGAIQAGISSIEAAVRMADAAGIPSVRVETRLSLGEALIHTQGELVDAGLATLAEAERIAVDSGDLEAAARARAELGLVDFRRASYGRSVHRLEQVLAVPGTSQTTRVKAMIYLGSVASDRADYLRAGALLDEARAAAVELGDRRSEAFSLSMLGRVALLRGRLDVAERQLEAAVELVEAEYWLSFLPWPQALLGHVRLAAGDPARARTCLEQAVARARQLNDPCWEAIAARGLALLRQSEGDQAGALEALVEARATANRLADPYVWLDVYLLDAMCTVAVPLGDERAATWVEEMHSSAARAGMRGLLARAVAHRGRLTPDRAA